MSVKKTSDRPMLVLDGALSRHDNEGGYSAATIEIDGTELDVAITEMAKDAGIEFHDEDPLPGIPDIGIEGTAKGRWLLILLRVSED